MHPKSLSYTPLSVHKAPLQRSETSNTYPQELHTYSVLALRIAKKGAADKHETFMREEEFYCRHTTKFKKEERRLELVVHSRESSGGSEF